MSRRIRWIFALGIGATILATTGASVFARSSATYTSHMLAATGFTANGDHAAPAQSASEWLSFGKTATWTYSDVSALAQAMKGQVYVNVTALSAGQHWGAGFGTDVRVVVKGVGTVTLTSHLTNPWRPHMAYNDEAGVGWTSYATIQLPNSIWVGAGSLTVSLTPVASGNHVGVDEGSMLIGYGTTP
jgi:hypothetical protein